MLIISQTLAVFPGTCGKSPDQGCRAEKGRVRDAAISLTPTQQQRGRTGQCLTSLSQRQADGPETPPPTKGCRMSPPPQRAWARCRKPDPQAPCNPRLFLCPLASLHPLLPTCLRITAEARGALGCPPAQSRSLASRPCSLLRGELGTAVWRLLALQEFYRGRVEAGQVGTGWGMGYFTAVFSFHLYRNIAALQCCVNFRYTTKWISYTHINIHFFLGSFPI